MSDIVLSLLAIFGICIAILVTLLIVIEFLTIVLGGDFREHLRG